MANLTTSQLIANDDRFIVRLEDYFMGIQHDTTQTDSIVLAIAAYDAEPTEATRLEIAATAYRANLKSIWKHIQIFKNSDAYQDLVAEFDTTVISEQLLVTEKVVSSQPSAISKPKPAKTPKAKPVLPMPAIASLEALEAMSRKDLIEATKGVNSNYVTGIRANAASLELKRVLAKHVLDVEYKPVTSDQLSVTSGKKKAKKVEVVIALPENLTWIQVKGMKYRELQALGKALRSNGYEMPRLNSKGEVILSAIAKALNFDTVHVPAVSTTRKPLEYNAFVAKYCPNLAAMAA